MSRVIALLNWRGNVELEGGWGTEVGRSAIVMAQYSMGEMLCHLAHPMMWMHLRLLLSTLGWPECRGGVDLKSSYILSLFSPGQACHDNTYLHSCEQSHFCATNTANNACIQTVEFTSEPEEYFKSLCNYQSNSTWSEHCSSLCPYNHILRTWEKECLSIQKWILN